jgi:hypothetical protein
MSFAATAATIRQRFATEFALVRATVPVAYANRQFTPPDNAEWVRLNIIEGDSTLAGIGGVGANLYRNSGLVAAQIFVPVAVGDGLAYEIADDIAAIFRSKLVSGVRFRTPATVPAGPDGPWYQRNVNVPFTADLIA